ncbi:hypothetical protein CPB86DRAFT_692364 [Serendipita vermifera]|nr:hypothetical protein CPB86DRAFT_692364 [Serendipita vermifera]
MDLNIEITNPMLVVIVGCFGLVSNILGLFLFHVEHGHGHSHREGHDQENRPVKVPTPAATAVNGERQPLLIERSTTPVSSPTLSPVSPTRRPRSDSSDSISIFLGHPVQNRAYVIAKAQDLASTYNSATSPPPPSPSLIRRSASVSLHRHNTSTSSHAFPRGEVRGDVVEEEEDEIATPTIARQHRHSSVASHRDPHIHPTSNLTTVEEGKAHGHHHHHGSMNMRALLLHVLGDALGNVGVISSGLIIWQTTWKWKYYSDPIISLLITVIIFSSALPLVKSASFILLQGVPENIKLDDLRFEIAEVEGVDSVHELHVWQLSETKHIASVHIRLYPGGDYMKAVHDIRRILHKYDIHNATIQPEFGEQSEQLGSCLFACPPGMCNDDQVCCRESLWLISYTYR